MREAQLEQVIPLTKKTTRLKLDDFFCSVVIEVSRKLRKMHELF